MRRLFWHLSLSLGGENEEALSLTTWVGKRGCPPPAPSKGGGKLSSTTPYPLQLGGGKWLGLMFLFLFSFLATAFDFHLLHANLSLTTTSVEHYVTTGVLEYQNNNFDRALDNFLLAENAGLSNPDLYFNIGNAHFRQNNIADAIVYYKKALLLNSSHKEARANLDFVLSITRDRQLAVEESFMDNFLFNSFYFFSINTLLVFCLILLAVIVIVIHVQWHFVNLDRTILRFTNFVLLFVLLCFSGVTVSRIMLVRNNNEAVVMENTVYVYSGPSESFTRLFTIHEGTVLRIHREEAGWTQITTLSGFSGWINTGVYRKIIN